MATSINISQNRFLPAIWTIALMTFLMSTRSEAQDKATGDSTIDRREYGQTVRGIVLDVDTKVPLPGATVLITSVSPNAGTVTDENGNFSFSDVPLGRIDVYFSYLGYEDRIMPNILVGSGQEVVLNISMQEAVETSAEAVVMAKKRKQYLQNDLVIASARTFSVEETKRYAGAIDDPARMVSAFAGVNIDPGGDNDIVIRGNSPRGILWRLEGVEIPNPNHFADEGSTGGPISALNSNMLSNSDFLTGAFSPEYGNALSGVFDMKLRVGNNAKREYAAGVSLLGTDLTIEGPFKKGYKGSYLANYRYSTLAILDKTDVVDYGGIPSYQDASFNVVLPVKENQVIGIFGLGGTSSISQTTTDDSLTSKILYRGRFGAKLGVIGLKYSYLISKKLYFKQQITLSGTQEVFENEGPAGGGINSIQLLDQRENNKCTVRIASTLNCKHNSRNKFKIGVIGNLYKYDLSSGWYSKQEEEFNIYLKEDGADQSLQAYASWKHRFSKKLTLVSGIHYLHLFLNHKFSIEPRASLEWKRNPKQTWTLGTGLHSKMESLASYLAKFEQSDGTVKASNRNMGLTKAFHFVGGLNQMMNSNVRIKVEGYYQHLFNVPVSADHSSNYSILNETNWFPTFQLTNSGEGRNYGLELTLERFLSNGFYYLATTSLYKSQYQTLRNNWINTAFDGNYILNVLGGKEFKVGSLEKGKTMFTNMKIALIGGGKRTPLDIQASMENNRAIYKTDQPFSVKSDDILKIDLAIGIRRNYKKINTEWKVDIQNITNHKAVIDENYISSTGQINKSYQLSILPVISYKAYF